MDLLEILFDGDYYLNALKQGSLDLEISEEQLNATDFNAFNHYKEAALSKCIAPSTFLLGRIDLLKSVEDNECKLQDLLTSKLDDHKDDLKDYLVYLVKVKRDPKKFQEAISDLKNHYSKFLEDFLGTLSIIDAAIVKIFFAKKKYALQEKTIEFLENVIDKPHETYNSTLLNTRGVKNSIWNILVNYTIKFAQNGSHAIFVTEKLLDEPSYWSITKSFNIALTKLEKHFAEQVFYNFEELLKKDQNNINALSFITYGAAAGLYDADYESLKLFYKILHNISPETIEDALSDIAYEEIVNKAVEAILITLDFLVDRKDLNLSSINYYIREILDIKYSEVENRNILVSKLLTNLIDYYSKNLDGLDVRNRYLFTEIFANILDTPMAFKENLESLQKLLSSLFAMIDSSAFNNNAIVKNIIFIVSRLHARYVKFADDSVTHFEKYLHSKDIEIQRLAASLMDILDASTENDFYFNKINDASETATNSAKIDISFFKEELLSLKIDNGDVQVIIAYMNHLVNLKWSPSLISNMLEGILSKISVDKSVITSLKRVFRRIYDYAISAEEHVNGKYGLAANMVNRNGNNIADIFKTQYHDKWDQKVKELLDHNQFFVVKDFDTLFEEIMANNTDYPNILDLREYLKEKFHEIEHLDRQNQLRYKIYWKNKEPLHVRAESLYIYPKDDKVFYKMLTPQGYVVKEIKIGDEKQNPSNKVTEEELNDLKKILSNEKKPEKEDSENIYSITGLYKFWDKGDFAEWKEKIQAQGVNDQNIAEVISRLKYAVHRTEGFFVRDSQTLTLLFLYQSQNGRLVQKATGEGKSTVITMFASLKVWNKEQVDIITTGEGLADRDFEEQQKVYNFLSITVSANTRKHCKESKHGYKKCYEADVVYGYPMSFMSDSLKDITVNTKGGRGYRVLIVDEVDNLFIDQIAMKIQRSMHTPGFEYLNMMIFVMIWIYHNTLNARALDVASKIAETIENPETVSLTNEDLAFIHESVINTTTTLFDEKDGAEGNIFVIPTYLKEFARSHITELATSLETAFTQYKQKVHFTILSRNGMHHNIAPLDFLNTGAIQYSLRWQDGLHQILQTLHGLVLEPENLISIYTSYISYFLKYKGNIYGVTGTLGTKDHTDFLHKVYGVDAVKMPNFIYKKLAIFPTIVAEHQLKWLKEIVDNVQLRAEQNRATLIICKSIEDLETISAILKNRYKKGRIFEYGNSDDNTAVKTKLRPGDVIIATNLAGRGANIKIDPLLEKAGGLHVILTYYPESIRVELQAFGRSGRKTERGSGQLIINKATTAECAEKDTLNCLSEHRNSIEKHQLQEFDVCHVPYLILKDELFRAYTDLQKEVLSPIGYKIVKVFPTSFFQNKCYSARNCYAIEENELYIFKVDNQIKMQFLGGGCYDTLDITDSLKILDLRSYHHILSAVSDKEKNDDFSYRDSELIYFLAALNGYDYYQKYEKIGRVAISYETLWRKNKQTIVRENTISNFPILEEEYLIQSLKSLTRSNTSQVVVEQLDEIRLKKLFLSWQKDTSTYHDQPRLEQIRSRYSIWLKTYDGDLLIAGNECDIDGEKIEEAKTNITNIFKEKKNTVLDLFDQFKTQILVENKNGNLFNNPAYLVKQALNYQDIDAKQTSIQQDLKDNHLIDDNSIKLTSHYPFEDKKSSNVSKILSCTIMEAIFKKGVPNNVYIDKPMDKAMGFLNQAVALNQPQDWTSHHTLAHFILLERSPKITDPEQTEEIVQLKRDFLNRYAKAYENLMSTVIPELQQRILVLSEITEKNASIVTQHHMELKVYMKDADNIETIIERVSKSKANEIPRATRSGINIENIKLYQAEIDCNAQTGDPNCYIPEKRPTYNETTTAANLNDANANLANVNTTQKFSFLENFVEDQDAIAEVKQFPTILQRFYGEGGYLYGIELVELKEKKDWTDTIVAGLIIAIQIGIGVVLASVPGGGVFMTTFGKSLIFQGISDIIQTLDMIMHDRPIDIENFVKSKAVGVTIAFLTAAVAHIGNSVFKDSTLLGGKLQKAFDATSLKDSAIPSYLIKNVVVASGVHILGKQAEQRMRKELKDSAVEESVEKAINEVINDHLEDLKIIFSRNDWKTQLNSLTAEGQKIIARHSHKYHNDGVTIATGVGGNILSMIASSLMTQGQSYNYAGAFVAQSLISTGAGTLESVNINGNFIDKFGKKLTNLANQLRGSTIEISQQELNNHIKDLKERLQGNLFHHLKNTVASVFKSLTGVVANIGLSAAEEKFSKRNQANNQNNKQNDNQKTNKIPLNKINNAGKTSFDSSNTAKKLKTSFNKNNNLNNQPQATQEEIQQVISSFGNSLINNGQTPVPKYPFSYIQILDHSRNMLVDYDAQKLGILSTITGKSINLHVDGIRIAHVYSPLSLNTIPINIEYDLNTKSYHSTQKIFSYYADDTPTETVYRVQQAYNNKKEFGQLVRDFQKKYPFFSITPVDNLNRDKAQSTKNNNAKASAHSKTTEKDHLQGYTAMPDLYMSRELLDFAARARESMQESLQETKQRMSKWLEDVRGHIAKNPLPIYNPILDYEYAAQITTSKIADTNSGETTAIKEDFVTVSEQNQYSSPILHSAMEAFDAKIISKAKSLFGLLNLKKESHEGFSFNDQKMERMNKLNEELSKNPKLNTYFNQDNASSKITLLAAIDNLKIQQDFTNDQAINIILPTLSLIEELMPQDLDNPDLTNPDLTNSDLTLQGEISLCLNNNNCARRMFISAIGVGVGINEFQKIFIKQSENFSQQQPLKTNEAPTLQPVEPEFTKQSSRWSIDKFLEELHKTHPITYKLTIGNLNSPARVLYAAHLYDQYLKTGSLENSNINLFEFQIHQYATSVQVIKEFYKEKMPRSSSLAKNILHVSEEVMRAVGLMLKELVINPTLDYFEATDPKTTHEVKKFFKDTTTATKKWFDSLTLPTQQTIKDLLRLTDVVGTALIVKGSLKSVTTAKSNTAAKPFLNTKIKATLTKAELEALKHIENLKNYLQDIEIPNLATAEGIPLNKIPKDSCPNIDKFLKENKNIFLSEIKNPNKIKTTSKTTETPDVKISIKHPAHIENFKWEIKNPKSATKIVRHPDNRIGKIYKDPTQKLGNKEVWWSKDTARHGGKYNPNLEGSKYKLFVEYNDRFKHIACLDKYGNVIPKYKSKVGRILYKKDLIGIK